MELFLNSLWLVMALVGLGVWRFHWANQPLEGRHAAWRQWSAFACALVLLFFMVSLTDDLHSELVVFEECSAARRHATCESCSHHAPKAHFTSDLIGRLAWLSADPYILRSGSVAFDRSFARLILRDRVFSGRAPPAVSL